MLSLPKLASITGETTNYYSFTQVQALAGGNVQSACLDRGQRRAGLAGGRRHQQQARRLGHGQLSGDERRGNFSRLQASNGGTLLDGSLTSLEP